MKAEKRADHYDGRHGKSFFDCIATIYLMTIRCCPSRMVFCVAGIFGSEADIDSVALNIVERTMCMQKVTLVARLWGDERGLL